MSTRKICINAMGIALFVVLALALQVPIFENYYLCLGYIVMAFYLYYFGTFSGTLVGTAGVILYCLITGGLRGMLGWTLGNVVIGVVCGIVAKYVSKLKSVWAKQILMIITIIISTALGILVAKSMTEVLLFDIPFMVRVASNIFAFITDVIVLTIGFEICISGEKIFNKLTKIRKWKNEKNY